MQTRDKNKTAVMNEYRIKKDDKEKKLKVCKLLNSYWQLRSKADYGSETELAIVLDLEEALENLTIREYECLIKSFWFGYRQGEIADDNGWTQQYVSECIQSALRKLIDELTEEGENDSN